MQHPHDLKATPRDAACATNSTEAIFIRTLSYVDETAANAYCEREGRRAPYAAVQNTSEVCVACANATTARVDASVKKQNSRSQFHVAERLQVLNSDVRGEENHRRCSSMIEEVNENPVMTNKL
jgi:hypothetical protein